MGKNKLALIDYLISEWAGNATTYAPKLQHHQLVVTCRSSCFALMSTDGVAIIKATVPQLQCSHEEADTRLILHAAQAAASGHSNIVIKSPDTTVAVLVCHFSFEIPARIFFRTGTKKRSRYIDISALARKHGRAICRALPGLHAFTGCDSTSAFVGRGKKAGLTIISSPSQDGVASREVMS